MADLYIVNIPSSQKTPGQDGGAARRRRALHKRKQQRLLYRHGVTNDELVRLVTEIGVERVLSMVDRITAPELPLTAAE
jgi:hypothetical protein